MNFSHLLQQPCVSSPTKQFITLSTEVSKIRISNSGREPGRCPYQCRDGEQHSSSPVVATLPCLGLMLLWNNHSSHGLCQPCPDQFMNIKVKIIGDQHETGVNKGLSTRRHYEYLTGLYPRARHQQCRPRSSELAQALARSFFAPLASSSSRYTNTNASTTVKSLRSNKVFLRRDL